MLARRINLKLLYEGDDISVDVAPFVKSVSIREVLGGEADTAEIVLEDREEMWMAAWMPERGATIDLSLTVNDWKGEGDTRTLPFGKFSIDEIKESLPPYEVHIPLTSVPTDSALNEVRYTHAWEKAKLSQIAQDVAGKAGLGCVFDAEEDPLIERAEQSEETGLSFLQKLCKDNALFLKVADKQIIIFDVIKYERQAPVMTIEKGQSSILHGDLRATIHKVYKACHVKYKHAKKDEYIEYTFTDPNREKGETLEVNEKVENLAEAEKLAKRKLHEENLKEFAVSFSMVGDFSLLASNTVQLSGWHLYDGKYIITRSSHEASESGYTTKVELRRVIDGY